MIYIDPPYNTGNKDFVYNDKFVDSEDDYRHSKWLSFISKRLCIARNLLKKTGMIFISVDDNEYANLKVFMDECFGNKNCLSTLVWDLGTGTSAGHFTRAHEYILVYCFDKGNVENFSGGEGIIDDRAIKKLSKKNHEFEYTFKAGTKCEAEDDFELCGEWGGSEKTKLVSGRFFCKNKKLLYDVTLSACWTQKNQMDTFFSGKETFDSKGQKVKEFYFRNNGKLYCRKERNKINPPSVLRDIATTKKGTKILSEILGELPFDFPKPVELITFLLSLCDNKTTILDFFAGSGTTLHATMQLNAEDGGHRQCILVTNNENGICENVTYERNKRVIQGYTTPKGEKVSGLTANTLRYYKTTFISRDRTQRNMHALVEAATDMLCIKEDLYEEQTHFGQYKTHPKVLRYFAQGNKRMLVLYRDEYTEEVAAEIGRIHLPQGEKIKVYIFSPSRYAYDDMFEDVAEKVELVALPAAIYDAYKKVLPKRREKPLELQTDYNEANEEGGEQ